MSDSCPSCGAAIVSRERLVDCNGPGGRFNSGMREAPVDGLALRIGEHHKPPQPGGYGWTTAQDEGPILVRYRMMDHADVHDLNTGEGDIVIKPMLQAGLILAEVELEP